MGIPRGREDDDEAAECEEQGADALMGKADKGGIGEGEGEWEEVIESSLGSPSVTLSLTERFFDVPSELTLRGCVLF